MAITRNEFLEALRAVVSSEFRHIPTDESQIDHVFSARFLKRMARLFRKQKRVYWKYVNTAAKRAAVIFVAVAMLFATACSFKPIREPIMKFFTEVYETFTAYFFEGKTEKKVIEKEYALDPIPEGFMMTNSVFYNTVIMKEYSNNAGDKILFTQIIADELSMNLDTEKSSAKTLQLREVDVLIYDYGTKKQAVWLENQYYFDITYIGEISTERFEEIVLTVK